MCRICLSHTDEKSDPLITPCKCSGSLQYVHLSCLQHWVRSRLNLQETENKVMSITWENLNCEICKTLFPFCISHSNQEYYLIPLKNKDSKYLILESFSKKNHPTGIHILDISHEDKLYLVTELLNN